jgi:hypothetical protein
MTAMITVGCWYAGLKSGFTTALELKFLGYCSEGNKVMRLKM